MNTTRFNRSSCVGVWLGIAANVLATLIAAGLAARMAPILGDPAAVATVVSHA
jgi:hypothetical protein